MKLIRSFHVNVENHDLKTAKTVMHIACEKMSKLRFYLVKHFPRLLSKRDVTGKLPLHIACAKNDIQFISWLFGNILAIEDDEEESLSGDYVLHRTRSLSNILSPSASVPSNKSLQVIFPQFPTDFSSTSSFKKKQKDKPGSYSEDDNMGECNHHNKDGNNNHDSNPCSASFLSEMAFGIDRSLSASYSASSRSGSSESSKISNAQQIFQKAKVKESFDLSGQENRSEERSSVNEASLSIASNPNNTGDGIIPIQMSSGVNDASLFFKENAERGGIFKGPRTSSVLKYSEEYLESKPSLQSQQAEVNKLLDLENVISLQPLTRREVVDIKPFSVDEEGDTIFHILARNDYYDSLAVMVRVANFLKHEVKLDMMTTREGFHSMLPIEEAVHVRSSKCVQKLIQLCMAAGRMPELLQDPHVLKCAVFVNDYKLVRILIENGFHQGIKPAISLAILSEYEDLLRILLFWQTQVINSMEYAQVKKYKGQRILSLNKGIIKWCEIQLESFNQEWLQDAACAASSVSQCLGYSAISGDITEKNFEYFRALGTECLQYFDNLSYSSLKPPHISLAPIAEVNISENQLKFIPIELFQMQNLTILNLSHNALTELPASADLKDNLYTSQLEKIDLDWNQLEELPEELFRGVANSLTELSVQYNQLERLPPGLWVMPKLKKIKLAHNKLEKLHTLSLPCFFNDFNTSNNIKVLFDTDSSGNILCNGDTNTIEVKQLVQYLQTLSKFYLTLFSARGLNNMVNSINVTRELIDIHIARCCTFQQTTEEVVTSTLNREPQILRLFEGEEDMDSIIKCTLELELLDLSYNQFCNFPWDLPCLVPKLQKLDFRGNNLKSVDIVHSMPKKILSVILVQNKLFSLNRQRSQNLPCGNVLRLLCSDDLVTEGYCQHCNHSALEQLSNLMLDQNELNYFPIMDSPRVEPSCVSSGLSDFDIIKCDTYFPELSILSLSRNKLTEVPKKLHQLGHLSSLDLSYNEITELPLEMGLINTSNLLLLKLDGMYIRNISEGLLSKPKQLINHLKSLKQK